MIYIDMENRRVTSKTYKNLFKSDKKVNILSELHNKTKKILNNLLKI